MKARHTLSTAEQATLAVREFRKMLPGLTAFVRALTGKPNIQVVMGANSGTDRNKVVVRPPLALANSPIHQRGLCDIREGNELICPACARLEEMYVILYHEISHHVAGSLKAYSPKGFEKVAIKYAEKYGSPEYAQYVADRAREASTVGSSDVYDYAIEMTNFLLPFIRATDDYRIDYAAAIARPGTESMRYYQSEIILDKGVDDGREGHDKWSDRPIEEQFPIGFLFKKQGHDIEHRLDPRVSEVFRVPVFEELLNHPIEDVFDVLAVSVGFLGELNKLGLYDLPLPTPPPLPMPAEPDPSEQEEQEQGGGSGGSEGGGSGNKAEESEDTENTESQPSEDASQQGEKDGQDAGSGHGQGNSSGNNSGDPDTESVGDNSAGGDRSENNESASSPETGNEQGGQENDQRPPDSEQGNGENSEDGVEEAGGSDNREDSPGTDPEVGDQNGGEGNDNNDPAAPDEKPADVRENDGEKAGDGTGGDPASNEGNPSPEGTDPDDSAGEGDRTDPAGESEPDAGHDGGVEIVGAIEGPREAPESGQQGAVDGEPAAPDFSDIEHATAEALMAAIEAATGHSESEAILGGPEAGGNKRDMEKRLRQAITKALVFDNPESRVGGLTVYEYGKGRAWAGAVAEERAREFEPLERAELSPSILHARRVFSDSKLDRNVHNLKKGKISASKLGKRAWNSQDDRLFKKKIRAEGIDDEVVIGMDVSGSTRRRWLDPIKKTAYAMAEVLAAVDVKFSVYAHSTDTTYVTGSDEFEQHMYPVKIVGEPWGALQKEKLASLGSAAGSLDGHNLEFYRKVLMRSTARRQTLVYYTDGAIPETNNTEEAMIITRELNSYKKLGINIMCVAFGSEGPKNYGLDTIKIAQPSDIITVIKELERRITM